MLRDYQVQDVAFHITQRRSLNLSDPGTGKTPTACVFSFWCWHEQNQQSVWVQPLSLAEKNAAELLRFTNFTEDDLVIVEGTPPKRQKLYQRDAKVWLIGADMWGKEWPILMEFQPRLRAMVADEIHMYWKSAESARAQGWFRSMKKMDRFLGLTGTLIDGAYATAYPAIHVIEPRYYGTLQGFKTWHAVYDVEGNITGWKNPERLAAILNRHSVRHSFEEVYGKEAKVIQTQVVRMTPGQAAMYKQLHDKAMIELEDRYVDAGLPGVFALRARQVLAHPEVFECKDTLTGKDEALQHHIAEGGSLVVFSCFIPEQERIVRLGESLGRKVGLLNGTVPPGHARQRIDLAFQSGELDMLVCSPQVASVGFNWGCADKFTFASLDYQDSSFFQAYRRGLRGKREKPLLIRVLQYADSIDARVFEIIRRKSREANAVDPSREVYRLTG